ncbi:MAG: hypothetical protein QOI66_742 [Myxococcales bacterium]|nr:hypothetical protein [Myxococcales bacterium]
MSTPATSAAPLALTQAKAAATARSLAQTKQNRLDSRKSKWFAFLLSAICFEGIGRKYLSFIPGELFYFLKDVVLIYGLVSFPLDPRIMRVMKFMFRPFHLVMGIALVTSVVQILNTGFRESFLLGVLGLRAYWLWWVAIPVVANILLSPVVRQRAILFMAYVSAAVAIFAVVQFGSPSDSAANTYAVHAGNEVQAYEVGSTGRPRVSSVFSFITGFTDFVVLIPPLLLSFGLAERERRTRLIATTTAILSAASLPMSGSRGPFVIGLFLLALVAREAGFLFTRAGRRVIVVGLLAILSVIYIFPESLQGIMDRFDAEDTRDRFEAIYTILPPYSLANISYPVMGVGTGMQQNFRNLFGVNIGEYESENEAGRILIELGVAGYLAVWLCRLGLLVAFLRAAKIFRRANRRAATGAALTYAILTFYGNLAFDHIWQALFFTGAGFILGELVTVWPILYPSTKQAVVPPPPRAALPSKAA